MCGYPCPSFLVSFSVSSRLALHSRGEPHVCPGGSLLLHVFHHLPGADFTTIDVAFGIDRDTLGRAGPFHFERIGDAV